MMNASQEETGRCQQFILKKFNNKTYDKQMMVQTGQQVASWSTHHHVQREPGGFVVQPAVLELPASSIALPAVVLPSPVALSPASPVNDHQ